MGERPAWTTAFAAFAIFTGFAGDFWRNLVTWYGFGAIALGILGVSIWLLTRKRPLPRLSHLPAPLLLFVVWCGASVIWSAYRFETTLGWLIQIITAITALALAVTLSKVEFVRALSWAMRAIVGLSLLFEVAVAIFFPDGVLPLSYFIIPGFLDQVSGVPGADIHSVPPGLLWSQGHIFAGAAIQGILGNRNLIGMVALLCVIVVGVQWRAGMLSRWSGATWTVVSLAVLALSRSATAIVGLAVVAFAVVLIVIARPLSSARRWLLYGVVGAVMASMIAFIGLNSDEVFGLINRTGDLSGRGDIWASVAAIAEQHWLLGLGWISYWAPWLTPFKDLFVLDGVHFLQAHNAYLDAWMQVGLVGAITFGTLVVSTLIRTWWLAIDRPQTDAVGSRAIPVTSVLAFLIMVALAVQSLTESRLLIEGNWLLLCYFAIYSKLRVQDLPALPRRTLPAHTGPILLAEREAIED